MRYQVNLKFLHFSTYIVGTSTCQFVVKYKQMNIGVFTILIISEIFKITNATQWHTQLKIIYAFHNCSLFVVKEESFRFERPIFLFSDFSIFPTPLYPCWKVFRYGSWRWLHHFRFPRIDFLPGTEVLVNTTRNLDEYNADR